MENAQLLPVIDRWVNFS